MTAEREDVKTEMIPGEDRKEGTKEGRKREDIKKVSASFLGSRMRTEAQVRDKLAEKGFSPDDIDCEIEELKKLRYIDDVEYALEYIKYTFEKGRSLARARCELGGKGVRSGDVTKAEERYVREEDADIRAEEEERAFTQGERFAAEHDMSARKNSEKLGRKLSSMGYESSLVLRVLERYGKV